MLHSYDAHNAAAAAPGLSLDSLCGNTFLPLFSVPPSMHLVVIGWLYVALMMAVAEATNTTGTVLGAIFTFLLYGLAPVALVVYLMGAPGRRRALKEKELAAQEAARRAAAQEARVAPAAPTAAMPSDLPDQRGEAPADPVAPVRKEP